MRDFSCFNCHDGLGIISGKLNVCDLALLVTRGGFFLSLCKSDSGYSKLFLLGFDFVGFFWGGGREAVTGIFVQGAFLLLNLSS